MQEGWYLLTARLQIAPKAHAVCKIISPSPHMHPEALYALRIDLNIWNALENVQKVETSVARSTTVWRIHASLGSGTNALPRVISRLDSHGKLTLAAGIRMGTYLVCKMYLPWNHFPDDDQTLQLHRPCIDEALLISAFLPVFRFDDVTTSVFLRPHTPSMATAMTATILRYDADLEVKRSSRYTRPATTLSGLPIRLGPLDRTSRHGCFFNAL